MMVDDDYDYVLHLSDNDSHTHKHTRASYGDWKKAENNYFRKCSTNAVHIIFSQSCSGGGSQLCMLAACIIWRKEGGGEKEKREGKTTDPGDF